MKTKYFLTIALGLLATTSTFATSKMKKKSKDPIKLVEAYTQRTLPGIPGKQITTNYHFIIVWEGAKYPETFFWRGENGWLPCAMARAHKNAGKTGKMPQPVEYSVEKISADQVHKGDTLELRSITGGKFPVPGDIPQNAKNTLYYKTGGSGWLSFPVKTIGKKPDIAMP